jgi:membrane associated rhomboid family serine protease
MTPVVRALLFANIGVFFLQKTVAPALTYLLAFIPQYALRQPWTIVTYMFVHSPTDFTHILFNMVALYFFGPRVEERMGSRQFTILYFLSGVSGVALSVALSATAPVGMLIGASAGVFGVMMGFAHYWPDAPIHIWGIIPVPARLLVIITTLMAFWFGFGGVQAGVAHFAHLGGYAGAWLYLRWLDRKRGAFKRIATAPRPESEKKVSSYKSIDLTKVHQVNRDEVNRILDKISREGVGALTPQERLFLANFVPPDDRPSSVH